MNESLKYLNTVFYSVKEFEEIWRSFDCEKSTEGLKKEINSRLNTIEKQIPSINEEQHLFLIENLENLISKGSNIWSGYNQKFMYYDFGVWHTQGYLTVDVINEYDRNRDSKLIEYGAKKETTSELLKTLREYQYRFKMKLSIDQIGLPDPAINKGDMNTLIWQKNDTDLLELVTALFESGSITNSTKDLTRKEAINAFMGFFGMEIKDAESKLSRATSRKKDVAQYLSNLKTTFEDYAKAKDDRLDSQRY